ncbi:MAG: hypothetical protein IPP29_18740 [Bacteroidetes bacterium]|nr:hypothetical protein [Bacteroidota bacterium]
MTSLINGAFIFNLQNKKFVKNISTRDGLPSNRIGDAANDNFGKLWITTANGIATIDANNFSIINYNDRDGVNDPMYHQDFIRPLFKIGNGNMILSATGGFFYWNPEKLHKEITAPKIAFDFFKVLNKDYSFINDTNINYISSITLPHDSNFFSFQFAAMHFVLPERNRYSYFLEGVDRQWTENTLVRLVNYTNVSPGSYTFHVKAANCDGVWGPEKTIQINITPAWYQTLWFKGLLVLIGLSIIYIIYLVRLHQIKLQKEKELALNTAKMKDAFLARMSHEIRTPMNAIMGMNQILIDRHPRDDQKEYLNAIDDSSTMLLSLINKILNYAKIESGKMQLEKISFNIKDCLDAAVNTIKNKAQQKGVEVISVIDPAIPEYVMGDPVRLKQILINLLGNAEKFTAKGKITLAVKVVSNENDSLQCEFKVNDTGIGISPEKLNTIFESFTQAGTDIARKYGGTGLGLAISKQLVELHNSNIKVTSEVNNGTTFSFIIKYEKSKGKAESKQILNEYILEQGMKLKGLRVLLAEDNNFNSIVAVDMLKK